MLRAAAHPRWAASLACAHKAVGRTTVGQRTVSQESHPESSPTNQPEGVLVDVLGSAERLSSSSPSSSPSATARPSPDAERAAADQAAKSTQPSSSSSVQAQTQNHTSDASTSSSLKAPSTKAAARMKPAKKPPLPASSSSEPAQSPTPAPSPESMHDFFHRVNDVSLDPSSSTLSPSSPPPQATATSTSSPTASRPASLSQAPPKPKANKKQPPSKPPPPSPEHFDLLETLFGSAAKKPEPALTPARKKARPAAAGVPFPVIPSPTPVSSPKESIAKPKPKPSRSIPPSILSSKPPRSPPVSSEKAALYGMVGRAGLPPLPKLLFGPVKVKTLRKPTLLPRLSAVSSASTDARGPVDGSGFRTTSLAMKTAIDRRRRLESRRASLELFVEKNRKELPPHLSFLAAGTTPAEGWTTVLEEVVNVEAPVSLEPAVDRPPVAGLAHSLDRVLFNPGVHFLRDPRSNVYNFDARIRDLPHPDEFDQGRFPPYVTASKDTDLRELAKSEECKFYGSTSTLTSCLSQVYFMIGRWKQLNTSMLSTVYGEKPTCFTYGAKLPASIYLKYNSDGTYAVDNDKSYESAGEPRLLSELGKVMEKLLTTTASDLARFRKDAPEEAVPDEERNMREAYHYTKGSKLLMRSQLDGVDSRLPGTGSFDIKTRSTIAVRMDMENVEEGRHYQLRTLTGELESFERERWDMMRSAFLKYSLQCRIGAMDGIFCAYHTTSTIHGFQYFSVAEMDETLFNSQTMGDQNFALSVQVLEKVFEQATLLYPGVSLELTMRTPDTVRGQMAVFVQPQEWDEEAKGSPKPITELRVTSVSKVDGQVCDGEVHVKDDQKWTVDLLITRDPSTSVKAQATARANFEMLRAIQTGIGSSIKLPTGLTEEQMQAIFNARWYNEVRDPNSGYAHLAIQQVESWDDAADDNDAHPSSSQGLIKRVETKVGQPPKLEFAKLSFETKQLRQKARLGKEREQALRAQLRGKDVEHWVQGELFADLAEDGVEGEEEEDGSRAE